MENNSVIISEAVENFETNTETLSIPNIHLQVPPSTPISNKLYARSISNINITSDNISDTTQPHLKDEKPKVFFNETYVIFLPECFFIYSWYTYKYYKNIIKKLTSKGIKVINISKIVKYQESTHDSALLFDDNKYPDPNILYIHLYNGLYYNDAVFNKRKIEKERVREEEQKLWDNVKYENQNWFKKLYGKNKKASELILIRVEELIAAKISHSPIPTETASWVA